MRMIVPFSAALVLVSASQAGASGAIGSETAHTAAGTYAASVPAASDYGRAREALLAGDYDRAVFLLEPLADGAGSQTQLMAGYANLGAGRLGRAELYFERALGRDPRSAYARHGLGLVALAEGNRAAAEAQLARIERAAERCTGTCTRGDEIEQAAASLRRALD